MKSKIQFVNKGVKKSFEKLKTGKYEDKKVYEWLCRAFEDIEENVFCGIQIPKSKIPNQYLKKYNIKNVWKYNLPDAWRLLYSIESKKIIILSVILEWLDHKTYEKRFRY